MNRRASYAEREALAEMIAKFVVTDRLTMRDAIDKAIPLVMPPRKQIKYSQAKTSWKWLVPEAETAIFKLQHKPAPPPPPPEAIVMPTIEEMTLETIMGELIRRFTSAFQSTIKEAVSDAIKTKIVLTTEIPDLKKETPKPRKLKIGICSLLPRQEQIIQAEFGADIDLRIIKSSHVDSQAAGRVLQNCQHVILMTNFIGHQKENSIRKMNSNCVRLGGGMTELRDKLTELYVKAEERA